MIKYDLLSTLWSKNAYSLGVDVAVKLLRSGGYRVGEILRLTWNDVLPEDRIIVRAEKKGTASLCSLPGISLRLQSVPPRLRSLRLFRFSYGHIYRYMLRTGWARQKKGAVHRSVTHTPRYEVAQEVALVAGLSVASNVLNHTSTTAITSYVPGVPEWWIEYNNGPYQGANTWWLSYNLHGNKDLPDAWYIRIDFADGGYWSQGYGYHEGFPHEYYDQPDPTQWGEHVVDFSPTPPSARLELWYGDDQVVVTEPPEDIDDEPSDDEPSE